MSKLVEVVIFGSFGIVDMTEDIKKILDKRKFPLNRTGEIVEYIRNNAVTLDAKEIVAGTNSFWDWAKTVPSRIIKIQNEYFLVSDKVPYAHRMDIKKVDTSKSWRIVDYDGAEYIQYLELKCINEELNYYEIK